MLQKSKTMFIERMMSMRDLGGFLENGEKPISIRNEEGRLHSDTQPAFRSATKITWYRNGQRHGLDADYFGSVHYYWKGVMIPDRFFLEREKLTIEDVVEHPNAEVRSVGIEIFGYDRLENEKKFKVVHRDTAKEMCLYKFESNNLHEPLMILKVKNSTPERDGTYKPYYLCVPPTMKTCRQAVAWTFDKSEKDYHPMVET